MVISPCLQGIMDHSCFIKINIQSNATSHYAKNSRNFGQKSNQKVHFGLVRPKYSGPPLEVVHFDQSDRNLLIHFDKLVHCPTSLQ